MGYPGGNEALKLVLDRLDVIIDLLKMLAGAGPSESLTALAPDLYSLYNNGETPGGRSATTNVLLENLLASALPSAPSNVRTIPIGTTEELIQSNESQALMRIDVTNLDVAQPLIVSKRGVTAVSGIQILARQTVPFVLPRGSQLYGIVALATVQVTVSEGYNIQPLLSSLFRGGR